MGQATTTELWCSGCKTTHPVSAFGVHRSNKRGFRGICKEAHAKAKAAYQKTERGRAVQAKAKAKYNRSEKGRAAHAKGQAILNERAWAIIGKTCAWTGLGGCNGPLDKDHIVPVKWRRTTEYLSNGTALNCWIAAHPKEAKKRIQCLCERHNCFKSDMPEDEARVKWMSRYPRPSSGQPLSSTDPLLQIAS